MLPPREGTLSGERVERRLAAILAADVAGYSRLIGADEEGTLRRLRAIRVELIDPKLVEHRGRIVKTSGDGMLVEFASVIDAVRCAGEVQRAMAERNAGSHSQKRVGIGVPSGSSGALRSTAGSPDGERTTTSNSPIGGRPSSSATRARSSAGSVTSDGAGLATARTRRGRRRGAGRRA